MTPDDMSHRTLDAFGSNDRIRPKRVAFLGYNTAGCWTALQVGLERRGVPSDIFGDSDHPFRYGNRVLALPFRARLPLSLARSVKRVRRRLGARVGILEQGLGRLEKPLRNYSGKTFAKHLGKKYSILFVEKSAHLLENPSNVHAIRRYGCAIALVGFGSDFRPAYLDGARNSADVEQDFQSIRATSQKKFLALQFAEGADLTIISFPGAAHFLRQPFVDRERLGFPIVPIRHRVNSASTDKIRVVHAPSNPRVKGSDVVRQVAESLTADHESFEFDFVTGVSRDEAMERLAQADLVVDQMYSDQYAGVLAREALTLGIPVVIGSYDAEWLRSHYGARIPEGIHLIHPDQLHDTLVGMLRNWKDVADGREQRARSFVATDGLDVVTDRWMRAALGNRDPKYLFDPEELDVPLGGFGPLPHLRSLIHGYVEHCGESALHLDDKHQLKQAVLHRGGLE